MKIILIMFSMYLLLIDYWLIIFLEVCNTFVYFLAILLDYWLLCRKFARLLVILLEICYTTGDFIEIVLDYWLFCWKFARVLVIFSIHLDLHIHWINFIVIFLLDIFRLFNFFIDCLYDTLLIIHMITVILVCNITWNKK